MESSSHQAKRKEPLYWPQVAQQIEVRVSEMLAECLSSDYSLAQVYIGKFRVRAYVHFHNILLDIFRGATVLFTTASCQGSLDLFAFGINSLKL